MNFTNELKRWAGDSAKQQATEAARLFNGVAITGEGYKCNGVSPCYVLLSNGSEIPEDAEIIADYTVTVECESCLENSEHKPATTKSVNPEFSGYALCAECAAEYDSRI